MKHNAEPFLKRNLSHTLDLIRTGGRVSLEVGSPSLLPFVFSCFDFKKLLVCQPGFFDDIFSSFGVFPRGVVGFPFIKSFDKGQFVIKSYNQETFDRSSVFFSSNPRGVETCVVDERSLGSCALYSPQKENLFVGGPGCSQEGVLSFLKKNGYVLVDSVSSSGEYVVRGGVVDVFSFGLSFPFRVGFFDNNPGVLFFNPTTGNIIKKESSCYIYPPPNKTKKSVSQCTSSFYRLSYKGGFLQIEKPCPGQVGFIQSKDVVSVLEHSVYVKKPSQFKASYSGLLLSDACYIKGRAFLPFWFSDKLNVLDKEPLPLSGTLKKGDYYVHEAFGVCEYLGFYLGEKEKEKVSLKFYDGKMNLDVRYLGRLSFYASTETPGVVLSGLNKTGIWKRRKENSYKEAVDFVASLIGSYIKRESQTNFGFSVDKAFLAHFLSSFPYVDTHDQSLAWKNILNDLTSTKPMHRLLCGDVGFGKTELAMRASFLASTNNKKTVILCPTTILSQQLFGCFNERLSPFGVFVGQVSRLTKKQKETVDSFLLGKIDVLIGTHAILKHLKVLEKASLIVVDEEHRFGVKDKEKILKHSPGCHYLNMSATPIPRTLQLSLSGIRNISTLLSPPQQRKPIITNVYYYSKSLIKTIVLDEMSRGGQVFIVDNSVKNVRSLFSLLLDLFPLFAVSCLFGSMEKNKISKTMSSFREGQIRVLVSTVIIESGIDIPSANTIIINNSHLFGLSQLHQLRGRVGRSKAQSYAYFLVPKKQKVSPGGEDRLRSIKAHSSLGSGYRLAVQDLQLRGAGSLFGYKQSGKNSVGFEYYSKLLSVAMKSKKYNKSIFSIAEVDLGLAYISSAFISVDEERAYYYKSISEAVDLSSLDALLEKTSRLFGSLPTRFLALFLTKKLSLMCEPSPVIKILKKENQFVVVCSLVEGEKVPSFLSAVEGFFNKRALSFVLKPESVFLKIQFKYIKEDYYILLEKLIKILYV